MNTQPDVLAVLDDIITVGELFGNDHKIDPDEMPGNVAMRHVRAAVAELIAAAQLSNKAHRLNARSDGNERGEVAAALGLDRFAGLDELRVAARDNVTAALARVGGGA